MRELKRGERAAVKWAFALFVIFWIAVIAFRIVAMSSHSGTTGNFN
jgi:hypothetical protein